MVRITNKNNVDNKRKHYNRKKKLRDYKKIHFLAKLTDTNEAFNVLFNMFFSIFGSEATNIQIHLLLLVLGMLVTNESKSVLSLFTKFIGKYSGYKLNSFYYTLQKAEHVKGDWVRIILRMVLTINMKGSPGASGRPIEIQIDDTLVEKIGEHFDGYAKQHDHTNRNGTNYLYGNCFVGITIKLPIEDGRVKYIKFPIAIRMWEKEEQKSKLKLAEETIRLIVDVIREIYPDVKIFIECDAWYTKGEIKDLVDLENVDIIGAVRNNTVMHEVDLPPKTGKRGRPANYKRVYKDDIELKEIPGSDYCIGHKEVRTPLFGMEKIVRIFATKKKNGKEIRLFICTDPNGYPDLDLNLLENDSSKAMVEYDINLVPIAMYKSRWTIEVMFYEHKKFWGLQDYFVRNKEEIEAILNLELIVYTCLTILPYIHEQFSGLAAIESIQTRRFEVGQFIYKIISLNKFDEECCISKDFPEVAEIMKKAMSNISLSA